MNKIKFAKDQYLFHEGQASDHVYRLVNGQAHVIKERTTDQKALGHIMPGDFAGEMGVLLGSPRCAGIRFTKDSELEIYTRMQFLELIVADQRQSKKLLHLLSLRNRVLIELLAELGENAGTRNFNVVRTLSSVAGKTLNFVRRKVKFSPSHANSQDSFADADSFGTRESFAKGHIVFREGDVSKHAFLLKKGQIEIFSDEKERQHIGLVESGEFFGEIGVLESLPRSGSAEVLQDSEVDVIDEESFYDLLNKNPVVFFSVIDTLCERSSNLALRVSKSNISSDELNASDNLYSIVYSLESLVQLTEQRILNDAIQVQKFLVNQKDSGAEMLDIYQKYVMGRATEHELELANAHFRNYVKMAGLGALFVLPGAPVTIPLAVKVGKALGVDLFNFKVSDPKKPTSSP